MSENPVQQFYFDKIERGDTDGVSAFWLKKHEAISFAKKIIQAIEHPVLPENCPVLVASGFLEKQALEPLMSEITPEVIIELCSMKWLEGFNHAVESERKERQRTQQKAQGAELEEFKIWFAFKIAQRSKVEQINDRKSTDGWKDFGEIYQTIGNDVLRRIRSNDEGVDGFIKNEELTKTTGLRHLLTLHRHNNKSQLAEKDGLLHQWLKELAKEKCVILTKWRSFEPMDNPSEQYNNRGQKYDQIADERIFFVLQDYVRRTIRTI